MLTLIDSIDKSNFWVLPPYKRSIKLSLETKPLFQWKLAQWQNDTVRDSIHVIFKDCGFIFWTRLSFIESPCNLTDSRTKFEFKELYYSFTIVNIRFCFPGISIVWISKLLTLRIEVQTRHQTKEFFGTDNWQNFPETGPRLFQWVEFVGSRLRRSKGFITESTPAFPSLSFKPTISLIWSGCTGSKTTM